MNEDFRIRFAQEGMALQEQVLFEGMVILNDPVVNDGQFSGGGIMRVRILIVGLSVGSPPGVAHTDMAVEVLTFDERLQFRDLSFLFINVQAPVQQRNAGAVVSAVLESLETFYDHFPRLTMTYVSNNSTHGVVFSLVLSPWFWVPLLASIIMILQILQF